jgi:hypothetical protein
MLIWLMKNSVIFFAMAKTDSNKRVRRHKTGMAKSL